MRINILCVDELGVTKAELSSILEKYNIRLFPVDSMDEALDILTRNKIQFRAILWSVNSMELDEFEDIMEIKAIESCKGIPVVILSKYTDRAHIIKAIEAGACEYIARPFEELTIAKKICKVLGIGFEKKKGLKALDEDVVFFNFSEMFSKELKCAGRGAYNLSIMMATLVRQGEEDWREAERIIKIVNRVVKLKLRETDTIFNYGPNNIMILLPFAGKYGVSKVEDKLKSTFESHAMIKKNNSGYRLVVSSVTFPEDGKVKDKLLKRLEENIEKAVREGLG